jgi:hypothetical protein
MDIAQRRSGSQRAVNRRLTVKSEETSGRPPGGAGDPHPTPVNRRATVYEPESAGCPYLGTDQDRSESDEPP